MAVPKNITKEHLLNAFDKIDREGLPKYADSQYYDVLYSGKKYPPKVVVSYANIFANGEELDRTSFSGGMETQSFKLLERNDFVVQKKTINYYVLGAVWSGGKNERDQSERFIQNGLWENGYDDKFHDIVKSVNVGDKVAIKSSYATKSGKSILRVKAIGIVYENPKDGKTLKVNWDKRFEPFDLEGFGGYRNTIQRVSEDDVDSIFKSLTTMSYFNQLEKFLEQSKENIGLRTSEYLSNFQGLNVEVSFGKGNPARIPWIAFLNNVDTVQNGIYPVYLYYKDKDLLILAYGISETNKPKKFWNLSNPETIRTFFSKKNLGKPERYGSSFVFKAYETTTSLVEKDIDKDLNELIAFYKKIDPESRASIKKFKPQNFEESIIASGLFINPSTLIRFTCSLLTKPFVILSGLSGSGKTKLAQAFAVWICESESQYCIVPVGADWTNREPLLGFPNALKDNSYVKPENKALDLIIDANQHPEKPYFLILDEMNLSHVERYFADFLSVMESKGDISLHSGNTDWNGVPSKIGFPKNLFIVGTVNIDETTYMFSPKVLDRANVIEFSVTKEYMETYLQEDLIVDFEKLKAQGISMGSSFVELAKTIHKCQNAESLNKVLLIFFSELKKSGSEFGYRSASEILRFAAIVQSFDSSFDEDEIIDAAIMQKLLPKVHGSRRKLEPVLKTLGALCLNEPNDIETLIIKNTIEFEDNGKVKYRVSFEKIHRMYKNVISNGFTSYAEA